jgi:hypothetical protein
VVEKLATLLFGEDGTGENPVAKRLKNGPVEEVDWFISCAYVP